MNYNIRIIREDEYYLLEDFIYEAIFIPEGVEPPPREIVNQPDIQVYIRGFGTEKDDICFVAEFENKVVGAVWVRDMEDYGHIADGVPSFAISLYKEYRNYTIEQREKMISKINKLDKDLEKNSSLNQAIHHFNALVKQVNNSERSETVYQILQVWREKLSSKIIEEHKSHGKQIQQILNYRATSSMMKASRMSPI